MLGEYPLQQIHKSMPNGLNTTLSVLEILFVSLLSYVFLSHLHWGSAMCVCVCVCIWLFKFFVCFVSVFFYPPSQDSVIQVTAQSYNSCNLKDPILYMNNGNSLFNITAEGEYFFTSGKPGHCEKKQKLHILVGNVTATAFSPSYGPSALPDTAPSYPTVFGTIPAPPSPSSSSSPSLRFSGFVVAAIGFVVCALLGGAMWRTWEEQFLYPILILVLNFFKWFVHNYMEVLHFCNSILHQVYGMICFYFSDLHCWGMCFSVSMFELWMQGLKFLSCCFLKR